VRPKRDKLKESDLQGFKYFKAIAGMLESLRGVSCERDRAHNRILHMDQYLSLILLYMFNPLCDSLRALQEASDIKKVQRVLGVPRSSLGSLSEAARVFDSQLLVGLMGELAHRLGTVRHDARLDEVGAVLTLVDGTWLTAVPKMVWALFQDDKHKAIKAHVQVELLKGVPVAATITDANTAETKVLWGALQAGRLYVLDRGYFDYALYQAVLDAHSNFVCRAKDNAVLREVLEERERVRRGLGGRRGARRGGAGGPPQGKTQRRSSASFGSGRV
jgi:hypothetical protein